MDSVALRDDVIDGVLACAAALLGTEVVLISGIEGETLTFERVLGEWPGLAEGMQVRTADSFCARMLAGAPAQTANAAEDQHYADAPTRAQLGITTYVGVPILAPDGSLLGTLCGLDREPVEVRESAVFVLEQTARIIAAHLGLRPADGPVIKRTQDGWAVTGGEPVDSLTTAMVLADLLAADLPVGQRPEKGTAEDEPGRLREAVRQLEHALAARVTVEQAIGVLAERSSSAPRAAFETLRSVARRNGLRVHDLARDVVASAQGSDAGLPAELRRRRPVPRPPVPAPGPPSTPR